MKVKAYFDRTVPFFLVSEPSFDATPVEVDEVVIQNVNSLNLLKEQMRGLIDEASAPEESDQDLCDFFSREVRKIFKTRKQDNQELVTIPTLTQLEELGEEITDG